MTWTDDLIEQLRTLVDRGLSAKQIGAVLKTSRNAIIGKVHRLGINLLTSYRDGNTFRADRHPAARVRPIAAARPERRVVLAVPTPVPATPSYWEGIAGHVDTLKHAECRWPLGDTYQPAQGFCRAPIAEGIGQPYCPYHRKISNLGTPRVNLGKGYDYKVYESKWRP